MEYGMLKWWTESWKKNTTWQMFYVVIYIIEKEQCKAMLSNSAVPWKKELFTGSVQYGITCKEDCEIWAEGYNVCTIIYYCCSSLVCGLYSSAVTVDVHSGSVVHQSIGLYSVWLLFSIAVLFWWRNIIIVTQKDIYMSFHALFDKFI